MSKAEQKTTASATVEQIAAVTETPEPRSVPSNLLGKEARVRAVHADTYHLLTNTLIPHDSEKKIKIDEFALAQLTAGKWELVE